MCRLFVPGHGWKGKQQWINADEDLGELYSTYSNKEMRGSTCPPRLFPENHQRVNHQASKLNVHTFNNSL